MNTNTAKALPVTIIGVGGMGSRIAEAIARMHTDASKFSLTLIDGDRFEMHNLGNQLMSMSDIGKLKVTAVAERLKRIRPSLTIRTIATTVTADTGLDLEGVVFLCLDSMEARRVLMKRHLHYNRNVRCVIETRMDSGVGISHCFDPINQRHLECWWLHWYPDTDTENAAGCGGRTSVISAVFGTTALALKQFEYYLQHGLPGIKNRIYTDFVDANTSYERWDA